MVFLRNGRIFVARYKRVTRAHLPGNIRLRRPHPQRAAPQGRRCWQIVDKQGCGFDRNILKFAKKIAKTPVVWKHGKMALNDFPNLYNKGTNKIKNKKIKKLFQSVLANSLVDMGTECRQ